MQTNGRSSQTPFAWTRLHLFFALVAVALSLASLWGWVFGVAALTSFIPGRPQLAPMTIAGLLAGAFAAGTIPRHNRLALTLGAAQLALGAFVVLARAFDWTLHLGLPTFWWTSKFTGLMLVASGAGNVMLALKKYAGGQVMSFGVLLFCGLMGLAHLFPNAVLYRVLPGTGVAIPTILGLAAISLSQLTACRSSGIAGALASHTLAGRVGQRLLFGGVSIVLALSGVLTVGFRLDIIDAETAVMLVGWSAVAVLGITLWGLAVAVDRADAARVRAERERDWQRKMVVAALSHDVRSPLQAATLSAVLLQRLAQGEQASMAIERLQRSHRRIDRMLRSLLDNLTLERGQPLQLHAERVPLHELVADVVVENAATLEGRVAWEGVAEGWWDRDAIYRVIENLLLNAAKYGKPDTPIWCLIETHHGEVELMVENEGSPIPEAMWGVIFQPFLRGTMQGSTTTSGWGVGLAFAREVATRHGGTVRVSSSNESKTTFALTLPIDSRGALGSLLPGPSA